MNKPLKECPACKGELHIKTFKCNTCSTEVTGKFSMVDEGLNADKEILDFIKVFIFAEGSIKQSEKLLNCSYPKIKNLLKKAKSALGVSDNSSAEDNSVIDQLDRGEIDVEEALKKLKS